MLAMLEGYQVYLEEARRDLDDQRVLVREYDTKARLAGATALAIFGLFGIAAGELPALWDLTKLSGGIAAVFTVAASGKAIAVLRTVSLNAPNLPVLAKHTREHPEEDDKLRKWLGNHYHVVLDGNREAIYEKVRRLKAAERWVISSIGASALALLLSLAQRLVLV